MTANFGEKRMFVYRFGMYALAALLTCHATQTLASPAFTEMQIRRDSARCNSINTRVSVAPNGEVISVLFDKFQVNAGTARNRSDRIRCDLFLKLAAPVETSTDVQLDVRGALITTGRPSTSSTVRIGATTYPLTFAESNQNTSTFIATLPKGARKLQMSVVVSARGRYPDSSALISIDSVDARLASK